MKLLFTALAATAFIAILTGCGTIGGRQYPSLRAYPATSYYPATAFDADLVILGKAGLFSSPSDRDGGHIPSPAIGILAIIAGALDLPISLVTDTILLPLDLARVPKERDRQSRMFDMTLGVQTTNAPGMILLDTSGRHIYEESEAPPWATFREVSSGRIMKVTWPEPFGCADSPEIYILNCVSYDGVRVERLKRAKDIQQAGAPYVAQSAPSGDP